ncbi:MAG TPA: hypothetical protein VFM72_08975 [Aequorivita sp.]|nr:hypothetical protein [Aequorivita sp.]
MKKLFLISVLFFGLQAIAQKTVYIYNLSSTNFDIGDMGTKNISAAFPIFISNPSGGTITIPSGTTYILEASPLSTTKFPFYSPSSAPVIDFWRRQLIAGGAYSNLPSNLVANVYGASQIIEHVKSQVGPGGTLGGGTLFPTSSNNYSDFYFFGSTGMVTLDVIDPVTGLPAPDGETYIIITD